MTKSLPKIELNSIVFSLLSLNQYMFSDILPNNSVRVFPLIEFKIRLGALWLFAKSRSSCFIISIFFHIFYSLLFSNYF